MHQIKETPRRLHMHLYHLLRLEEEEQIARTPVYCRQHERIPVHTSRTTSALEIIARLRWPPAAYPPGKPFSPSSRVARLSKASAEIRRWGTKNTSEGRGNGLRFSRSRAAKPELRLVPQFGAGYFRLMCRSLNRTPGKLPADINQPHAQRKPHLSGGHNRRQLRSD